MLRDKIEKALRELLKERPVFHSEADFQHEFAMGLRKIKGFKKMRLEKPFYVKGKSKESNKIELDIYAEIDNKKIGVELKYKTRRMDVIWGEELFSLKSHYAQNLGRYDFIKDIYRLEALRKNNPVIDAGFAIMLTNDSAYYELSRRSKESKFGISFLLKGEKGDVVLKSGILDWKRGYNLNSVGNARSVGIPLSKSYGLAWKNACVYKNGQDEKVQDFKYLLVAV